MARISGPKSSNHLFKLTVPHCLPQRSSNSPRYLWTKQSEQGGFWLVLWIKKWYWMSILFQPTSYLIQLDRHFRHQYLDLLYIRRYLRYDLQLLERARQIPKRTCLYHPVPVINCVSLGCSHMRRRLLSRTGRQREIKEETYLSGLDAWSIIFGHFGGHIFEFWCLWWVEGWGLTVSLCG